MAAGYTLSIQQEGSSKTESFPTLEDALAGLQAELNAAGPHARKETVKAFIRDFPPSELVAMRLEIRGRGVCGGIDLQGDGSQVAYTGRLKRKAIEPAPGQNAVGALREALIGEGKAG